MSKKKIILTAVIIVIVGIASFFIYRYVTAATAFAAAGVPVEAAFTEMDTITSKVTAKGEVSLLNTELIYANIEAEIDEVLAEKNDVVKKGQPIIKYKEKNRIDLENAVTEAKLNVTSAELALINEQTPIEPPSETSVERARLDVERAKQAIQDAETDVKNLDEDIQKKKDEITDALSELEDSKVLLDAGAISQNEYNRQEKETVVLTDTLKELTKSRVNKLAAVDNAVSSLHFYELTYKEVLNPVSDSTKQNRIKQQKITLEKAQLALTKLERELENYQSEIVSPINGTVINVNASRGEITSTSKALMEIADITDYVIRVDINERNAGKIRLGQKAELNGAVLGNETIYGTVTKIGNIADLKQNNSGTERVIPVEITVNGSGKTELKPGFSLDAAIITDVRENVVVTPILSTLSESDGSYFVFIIKDDNTLEKRSVTLGAYADMTVEVNGIEAGVKIVAQPNINLSDGLQVSSQEAEGEAGDA